MVIITSTKTPTRLPDPRPAALDDSLCETCHSVVDLTTSVLMKGHRIVGCPACDWITSPALSA
jgi:hypothetical protein